MFFYGTYLIFFSCHFPCRSLLVSKTYTYDGLRRTPGLRRKLLVSVKNPCTDPRPALKKMIPTLSWQTPTISLRVLCGCSVHGTRNEKVAVCHNRVGIIFFCGMWGSVWGSFTGTTGSLCNPETRRTPSYVYVKSMLKMSLKQIIFYQPMYNTLQVR